MAVYRFKVAFEDHEEIYREIEIKSTQNFEDFHSIILKSVDFDDSVDASFFISDDYWRKGEEIVFRETTNGSKNNSKMDGAKRVMHKCKMASLIEDPHQKFIYLYDTKNPWTFMIELLKIVPDDPKATYPKCVKTIGISPKNTKTPIIAPVVLEDDELDDDILVDDEAYTNAHSEDEIATLEGDEGEEEETEETEAGSDEEENEFEDLADQNFEED
jgi:hypothetical protein